jgi:hypothetical protein
MTDPHTEQSVDRMVQAARAVSQAMADFSAACAIVASIMQSFNEKYRIATGFKQSFPVRKTPARRDD